MTKKITLSSIYTLWKGMYTLRLAFRKLSLEDEQVVYRYSSNPEVTQYVLFPTHKSTEDTRAFIKLNLEKYEKGEIACWAVTLKDTGELVGTADFVWWNLDHKKAEVGYCFAKEHWNKGYASEALMVLIKFGFIFMDLHRIEARCFEENKASVRVMEKAGMSHEGLMRDMIFTKGRYWNINLYAILKDDFYKLPKYAEFELGVDW
jgi:[ribosomal protein S5]-alanine N-acetyltransferase